MWYRNLRPSAGIFHNAPWLLLHLVPIKDNHGGWTVVGYNATGSLKGNLRLMYANFVLEYSLLYEVAQ